VPRCSHSHPATLIHRERRENVRPPDIVIADGGRFVAARAPDGHYSVTAGKEAKIVRSFFASETGETLTAWPAASSAAESGLDCAGELCRYSARGRTVAIVTGDAVCHYGAAASTPLSAKCRSDFFAARRSPSSTGSIPGDAARSHSGSTATVSPSKASMRNRGDRPWVRRSRPARKVSSTVAEAQPGGPPPELRSSPEGDFGRIVTAL